MPDTIQVTVTGTQPAPPSGTRVGSGKHQVNVHKVLAVGNLLCGLGLVIANIVAVVLSFATLQLLSLVVRGAIALGGTLIATAALTMLPSFVRCVPQSTACVHGFALLMRGPPCLMTPTRALRYIGLVQFPFGTGCLLLLLGALNLGTGETGRIVGGASMGWGVISCLLHLWLRGKHAAVHMQLLNRH